MSGNPLGAGVVKARQHRAYWLKTLHRWHWISSAVSLVGLLLFTITGITLNHAAEIEAEPTVVAPMAELPPAVLADINTMAPADEREASLPDSLRNWLATELSLHTGNRSAEWSAGEIYVPLPKPGGDAWLSINRESGAVEHEDTNRGWISWLNDLHKGRNTGEGWRWFIDVFAIACLVFCVTGFFLLQLHSKHRPSTWPMVGFGVFLPALLIILFVH